jgi:choline dehydrogenase-like flavoprotein
MAQVTIQARSSRCEPGLWDLFHIPALEEGADGRFEASAATFVMRPHSRGSVRLASEDPRVPPVVDHGLLTDPVDADCRVVGLEGLYVADASVMPEVPRVNTNLATAAVAERVSDLLAGAPS